MFWEGFGVKVDHPTVYPNHEDTDRHFRVYDINQSYLERVKQLKEGKEFEAKALQETKFLDKLVNTFHIEQNLKTPQSKLCTITYFKEIVDCELNSEGQKLAIIGVLTKRDLEEIDELSHWVWSKRFFMSEYAESLGGRLLDELVKDFTDPKSKFSVYSAHDYTILSLLAALGKDDYPGKPTDCLGYSSFLLFEVYKPANGGEDYVKLSLNMHTFESDHGEPHAEVQFYPLCDLALDGFDSKGRTPLHKLQKRVATFKLT